jgi:hypothetical protein
VILQQGESAGWTNERHGTYISTMEASFLDQLYGLNSHRIDAKRNHLGGNGLKVIRDGMCKNIRFEGADAPMHDGVTSGLPDNLSIKRFRPRNAGVNRCGGRLEESVDDYGSGTDTVREKVRIHGRETKGFPEESFTGKRSLFHFLQIVSS